MNKKKIMFGTLIASAVLGVSACSKDVTPTEWSTTPSSAVEQQWNVAFNVEGGTEIQTITVKNGSKITKPNDPQKNGYIFKGWYKESACNYEWIFDVDVVTANTTLYAKWEEKAPSPEPEPTPEEKYSVTYVINGHGEQPEVVADVKNLPSELPILTDEGYSFIGWYLNEELTEEAQSGAAITANTTLYAKWEENVYTISFEINGYGEQPASLNNVKLVQNLPVLTADDMIFEGWYEDEGLQNKVTLDTKLVNDITLYAKWIKTAFKDFLDNGNVKYATNFKDSAEEILYAEKAGSYAQNYKWYATVSNLSALNDNYIAAIENGYLHIYDKSTETEYVGMKLEDIYSSVIEIKTRIKVNYSGSSWKILTLNGIDGKSILDITTLGDNTKLGYSLYEEKSTDYLTISENQDIDIAILFDLSSGKISISLSQGSVTKEWNDIDARVKDNDGNVDDSMPLAISSIIFKTSGAKAREINVDWFGIRVVEEKLDEWKEYITKYVNITNSSINKANYQLSIDAIDSAYTDVLEKINIASTMNDVLQAYIDYVQTVNSVKSDEEIKAEEYKPEILQKIEELRAEKQSQYTITPDNEKDDFQNTNSFNQCFDKALVQIDSASSIQAMDEIYSSLENDIASLKKNAEILAEYCDYIYKQSLAFIEQNGPYSYNEQEIKEILDRYETEYASKDSKADIRELYSQFEQDILNVRNDDAELSYQKELATSEINFYLDDEINALEGYDDVKESIKNVKSDAIVSISKSLSIEELNIIVKTAQNSIDTLYNSTIMSLDELKKDALNNLKEYALNVCKNYPDIKDQIDELIDENIFDEAENSEDINTIYNSKISEIDGIVANYNLDIYKQKSQENLAQEIKRLKDDLKSEQLKKNLQDYYDSNILAFEQATDEKEVDDLYTRIIVGAQEIYDNRVNEEYTVTFTNAEGSLILHYGESLDPFMIHITSLNVISYSVNDEEYGYDNPYVVYDDVIITLTFEDKIDFNNSVVWKAADKKVAVGTPLVTNNSLFTLNVTKATGEAGWEYLDNVNDKNKNTTTALRTENFAAGDNTASRPSVVFTINDNLSSFTVNFALSDSKFGSNRTGNVHFVIDGKDKVFEYSTSAVQYGTAVFNDLVSGTQIEMYADNLNTGSRIFLFDVEALLDDESAPKLVSIKWGEDATPTKYAYYEKIEGVELPYDEEKGYFAGWYQDSELTVLFEDGTKYKSYTDITLYPKYSKTNVSISYKCNEETGNCDFFVKPGTKGVDWEVEAPKAADGYIFLGWYNVSDNTLVDFSQITAGAYDIYARYEKLNVKITYKVEGLDDKVEEIYLNEGVKGFKNEYTPSVDGYNFLGWYQEGKDTEFDFSEVTAGEYVLIAKMEAQTSKIVTVGFDQSNLSTEIDSTKINAGYLDEYDIIDMHLGHGSAQVDTSKNIIKLGGKTSKTNYILIDLSKYTGSASVKLSSKDGADGRNMFVSEKQSNAVSDAVKDSCITGVKNTIVSASFELECGKKYWLCTDNTCILAELSITLDVLKLAQ